MDRSVVQAMRSAEITFRDGLGDRVLGRDHKGRPLTESLHLRAELSAVPAFEFSLTERLADLQHFEHSAFVPIRTSTRLAGALPHSIVTSDYSGGTRLSEVLTVLDGGGKCLPTASALALVRDLLEAVGALHRLPGEIAHGTIGPERIVVLAGRIRITDFVYGSAIEQLRFTSERYWKELRVAVPFSAGGTRFDRRVDVAQIGMVALALLAGRPLRDTEQIGHLGETLGYLLQDGRGERVALASSLRTWLARAVHMDPRRVFTSAAEAQRELEDAAAEAGFSLAGRAAVPTAAPVVTPPVPVTRPAQSAATLHTLEKVKKAAPPPMPRYEPAEWYQPPVRPHPLLRHQHGHAPNNKMSPQVRSLLQVGVMGVLLAGGFSAGQYIRPPAALFGSTGTLIVDSKPHGAQLLIDGQSQGVTPLTLKVKSGRHEVELRSPSGTRVFNVWISNGANVTQYVEFDNN
jgi:serine/threonine protein kinase